MRRRHSAALGRFAPIGACAVLCALLANCSNGIDPKYGVSASPRVIDDGSPVPKGGGVYRVGHPYTVAGRTYVPEYNPHYQATGLASWYGDDFHGRRTANGEIFDLNGITAAHTTMPLPSYARVTNLSNGRSLIVRVNDRGPYHGNRIIDVSKNAARLLGFHTSGTAWVRVEYVGHAPIEGSDDRILAATLATGRAGPGAGLRQARCNQHRAGGSDLVHRAQGPLCQRLGYRRLPRVRGSPSYVLCRRADRQGRHRSIPQRAWALLGLGVPIRIGKTWLHVLLRARSAREY